MAKKDFLRIDMQSREVQERAYRLRGLDIAGMPEVRDVRFNYAVYNKRLPMDDRDPTGEKRGESLLQMLLTEAGPNPSAQELGFLLFRAVRAGSDYALCGLLEAGADVTVTIGGRTPELEAESIGKFYIAGILRTRREAIYGKTAPEPAVPRRLSKSEKKQLANQERERLKHEDARRRTGELIAKGRARIQKLLKLQESARQIFNLPAIKVQIEPNNAPKLVQKYSGEDSFDKALVTIESALCSEAYTENQKKDFIKLLELSERPGLVGASSARTLGQWLSDNQNELNLAFEIVLKTASAYRQEVENNERDEKIEALGLTLKIQQRMIRDIAQYGTDYIERLQQVFLRSINESQRDKWDSKTIRDYNDDLIRVMKGSTEELNPKVLSASRVIAEAREEQRVEHERSHTILERLESIDQEACSRGTWEQTVKFMLVPGSWEEQCAREYQEKTEAFAEALAKIRKEMMGEQVSNAFRRRINNQLESIIESKNPGSLLRADIAPETYNESMLRLHFAVKIVGSCMVLFKERLNARTKIGPEL